MLSTVAYGIMGTAYRQEVVVDEGVRENGSLKVLQDFRRQLSMQYGDDTPMTGWALQPAPAGVWLTRVERAFDSNYAPAYIAIAFLIPLGRQPKGAAMLKLITDTLTSHHSDYIRQSVIQGIVNWHFLQELSEDLEAYLTFPSTPTPPKALSPKYGITYSKDNITTLLDHLWDDRIAQCRMVFSGRGILTADKEFMALEDIPSIKLPDPIQDASDASNDSKDLSISESSDVQCEPDKADVSDVLTIQEPINEQENEPINEPTNEPTNKPTNEPKNEPTIEPTNEPTNEPIIKDSPKKETPKTTSLPHKTVFWIIGALVVLAGIVVVAVLLRKSLKPKQPSPNTNSQKENNINTIDSSETVVPENRDKSFTVNGITFSMKYVEGGTFRMGSDDRDADEDETPVHEVTVSSFHIGETEVTQALWRAVMGNSVQQQRDKAKASWPLCGEGDDYPMYYVNWDECQAFVRELNRLTGEHFRLPTEAEWEYAARGGAKSGDSKYSGSNDIGEVAWYDGNSGKKTHPVKKKQPNELGIYDMSGNVWEWCQDWYGEYTDSAETDPTGPASGTNCVLRGGGWYGETGHCRVSNRVPCALVYRYYNIGFRIVLE